jgi:hypothetical protein
VSDFPTYRESERVVTRPERGLQWPMLVVGLLLLNVSVCAFTVVSAIRSPIHIESEYYAKAVDWDATRRDWPAADVHGWTIDTSVSRAGTGQSLVGVSLRDAEGAPVRGARVECTWFPVLDPDARERLLLEPATTEAAVGLRLSGGADAWHLGVLPDGASGRWKLTVDVVMAGTDTAPEQRARTELAINVN